MVLNDVEVFTNVGEPVQRDGRERTVAGEAARFNDFRETV
jgi:hypothetical protein